MKSICMSLVSVLGILLIFKFFDTPYTKKVILMALGIYIAIKIIHYLRNKHYECKAG